jgi:hypothetical protein
MVERKGPFFQSELGVSYFPYAAKPRRAPAACKVVAALPKQRGWFGTDSQPTRLEPERLSQPATSFTDQGKVINELLTNDCTSG